MCSSFLEIARKIGLMIAACFACAVLMASMAGAVELQPSKGITDLGPHLKFHSAPAANLGTILQRFKNGEFSDDLETSLLNNNYAREAWAAAEIVNATIDDGRVPDPYVMTLSLALASAVDVYVIRESGFTESLLNYNAFVPFVPEDHVVTRLRTPEFAIAPQEKIILLVNFKFGPIQSFQMALETPPELEASAFLSGIFYTAFYAFCISCLVFFFGFHLAMKNWIGFFYAFLFTIALIFIGYVDGLLFRFLYPDDPQWHSATGFGLLFAISGIGFFAAGRSIVIDGEETRQSLGISALSVLSAAGFLISIYSPGTYAALGAYVLLGLMLAVTFFASAVWKRRDGNVQISAMLTAAFSGIAVVGVLLVMVFGWANDSVLIPDAAKAVFAALLLATMTSLTVHMINLRRMHTRAVTLQIAALKEEAQRSQELLESEKNYSRVRDLASHRQKQLATASHDLKQPIASLRMTFDTIADQTEPAVRDRLREAFDYMEALSSDYLKDTMPEAGEPADDLSGARDKDAGYTTRSDSPTDAYELSVIIGTVHQMFHEEAISKGLKLRMVSSSSSVVVPPIALMRIVSNLVSNAVKYTLTGGVLIGVRNRQGRAYLQVIDTGPGMDPEELATFKVAYRRGDSSKGQGLGMSVCFELAQEHELDLTVDTKKNSGTRFSLRIPLATGNDVTEKLSEAAHDSIV